MKLVSVVMTALVALALSSTGFAAKQQAHKAAAQNNAAAAQDANAADPNNPNNAQNAQQDAGKNLAAQKNIDQQKANESTEND